MTCSKSARPAPGRPFQKGDDPRRNKGAGSKEAQSWAILFKNALAKKLKPGEVADILAEQVRRGRPWAIELYLDRMVGKPKDNEGEPVAITVLYASDPIPGDGK